MKADMAPMQETPAEFYGEQSKMRGKKFSRKRSKRHSKRHGRRKGGR